MVRRWMGVALVAAGLTLSAPARAQYLPSQVGAARMPEPIPCGPTPPPPPQPNLIPGPLNPDIAPMGPPDCVDLPWDHTSAFQCENFVEECHFYVNVGAQALVRQRLGAGEIAARAPDLPGLLINRVEQRVDIAQSDVQAVVNQLSGPVRNQVVSALSSILGITIPGNLTPVLTRLRNSPFLARLNVGENVFDTLQSNGDLTQILPGLPSSRLSPMIQQFNNLVPRMEFGPRWTAGYVWGDGAIEYTGYYLFRDRKTIKAVDPRHINVLFYNPPAGFGPDIPSPFPMPQEGSRLLSNPHNYLGSFDHGIFMDATAVLTSFSSTFWSNEVNYRRFNTGIHGFELLMGVRYVQEHDDLAILSSHGDIIPELQATYGVHTVNNIVAPQIGCEYTVQAFKWASFGFSGKAGLGANFIDSQVKLVRGDGLVGFDTQRAATVLSQIYDIGAFLDFHILERLRLRFGYNAIWLIGVATAPDQVDYNLQGNQRPLFASTYSQETALVPNLAQRILQRQIEKAIDLQNSQNRPHGRVNNNGSILFHGPLVELQFLF